MQRLASTRVPSRDTGRTRRSRDSDDADALCPTGTGRAGPRADVTATKQQVLHTHLGRLPVSVREGRVGATGGRSWVAQLHSDLPEVEAVGDVVGATEREALAGLALAVRRYGARPADRHGVTGRIPRPRSGYGS